MTEQLKELIENAPLKTVGVYDKLMFVSNGIYDGFWGANGYDHILVLGWERETNTWYRISAYGDKFDIYKTNSAFNLDIPTDYGVPCIWFNKPIYIDNSLGVSNVVGELVERESTDGME